MSSSAGSTRTCMHMHEISSAYAAAHARYACACRHHPPWQCMTLKSSISHSRSQQPQPPRIAATMMLYTMHCCFAKRIVHKHMAPCHCVMPAWQSVDQKPALHLAVSQREDVGVVRGRVFCGRAACAGWQLPRQNRNLSHGCGQSGDGGAQLGLHGSGGAGWHTWPGRLCQVRLRLRECDRQRAIGTDHRLHLLSCTRQPLGSCRALRRASWPCRRCSCWRPW